MTSKISNFFQNFFSLKIVVSLNSRVFVFSPMTFRCQNTFSIKHVTTQTHKHLKFGHKRDNDVETSELKFTQKLPISVLREIISTLKLNIYYTAKFRIYVRLNLTDFPIKWTQIRLQFLEIIIIMTNPFSKMMKASSMNAKASMTCPECSQQVKVSGIRNHYNLMHPGRPLPKTQKITVWTIIAFWL